MNILCGSNDGAGNATDGFICRGSRMLNEKTYENTWDLLSSIPSFDHAHPTHSNARLINKDEEILDVMFIGFNTEDRIALGKLMITPEEKLDNLHTCD